MSDYVKREDAYRIALRYGGSIAGNKIEQLPTANTIGALQADNDILRQHIEDLNEAFRSESLARQKAEAAQPHWVSVEEGLPRYGDWVLCLGPKSGYYVSEFRGVSGLVGPRFHANGRYINATHWMPLPEPPQEVQE